MKSLSIAIVLLVYGFVCFSQRNVDDLLGQRNDVYQKYSNHNDTMTVNTWMNIMNSKKLLEKVVHLDSIILDAYLQSLQQVNSDTTAIVISQLKQELDKANHQLQMLKQDTVVAESKSASYKKYIGALSVVSFLLFVLIIILAFLTIRVNKSLKLSEKEAKRYHTDLYAANHQIEKSIEIENQLASEINRVKQHNKELEGLVKDAELALEEKLLLDNQIIEVEKAYELEVSKRMDLENQLKDQNQEQQNNPAMVLKDEMIADLQAEIFDLTTVNESLKRGLDMALEKNMTGDQLLIDELDKLKIKYDIEVKTRQKTEEELQVLITKLKSHFKS